MMHAIGKL